MSATLTGYTDAFAATSGNASTEDSSFRKLDKIIRKLKKKNKKLKRALKEQRATETQRIAEEQRKAEERQKKEKSTEEKSLSSRVIDAVVKAIPAILSAAAGFFLKRFFAPQKECKCAG